MPRSFSIGLSSSTCSCISRADRAPVISRIRSESVVFPWSMCATIEKLRMREGSGMAKRVILRDGFERPPRAGGGVEPLAGPARAEPVEAGERDHRRVVSGEGARREEDGDRERLAPRGEALPQERVRGHAARDGEERDRILLVEARQP